MNIFKKNTRNNYRTAKITPFDIRKTVSVQSLSEHADEQDRREEPPAYRPTRSPFQPQELQIARALLVAPWARAKLEPSESIYNSLGFHRAMHIELVAGASTTLQIEALTAVNHARFHAKEADPKLHFVFGREAEDTQPPCYVAVPRVTEVRVEKLTPTIAFESYDHMGDLHVYWVKEVPGSVPKK